MADWLDRVNVQALPRIEDRLTFLYVERCKVHRSSGAIQIRKAAGTFHYPAAQISVLLLGPGTEMTHRAMELLGDCGSTVLWVGEQGVRYYAHGRSLSQNSKLVMRQAELVSNQRSRLAVARRMYSMRFHGEDVKDLTMQQLRGREGARVRAFYRKCARKNNIDWQGRSYDVDNYADSSPVNQALSSGTACLYGVVHAVIVALGLSPALGFIHTGHARSFVFDIADLYKADYVIPLAFKLGAEAEEDIEDIGAKMRRALRDKFRENNIFRQIVGDLYFILGNDLDKSPDEVLYLWDDQLEKVDYGVSY